MNITYTWQLTGLKRKNTDTLDGVVYQTYWKKIGTDSDSGFYGEFIGATPFDSSAVNPEEFVPYSLLTEEIVLGWVQDVVVGAHEEHVNSEILRQIEAKISQDSDVYPGNFPWDPVLPPQPPLP
jgi:hypothetical protein